MSKNDINSNDLAVLPVQIKPDSFAIYGFKYIVQQYGTSKLFVTFYCHKKDDTKQIVLTDSAERKIKQQPEAYFDLTDAIIQTGQGTHFNDDDIVLRACSKDTLFLDSVTYSDVWPREDIHFSFKYGNLSYELDPGLLYLGTTSFFARNSGRTDGSMTAYFHKSNGEKILRYHYLQTDIKGPSVIHENEFLSDETLTAYPNPAKNYINIKFSDENEFYKRHISLADMFGKIYQEFDSESNISMFDLSNLSQGLYFINVIVGSRILHKKVLILK